jgi:hypothetical protein
VYYEIGYSSTKNLAATVTDTSYTHTGLQADTTYYYYIKAVNSAGESDYSDNDYARTQSSGSPLGSELSQGTWKDGSVSSESVSYFYFYATSGSSYTVYWNDSYDGNGSKTGDVEVSAYWYSDDESIFTRVDNGYSTGRSITATKTGYVMLKVEPYSSNSVGTFAIRYQSSGSPSSLGSELSQGTWEDGSVNSESVLYYYFYATSGSSYTVYWNDSDQGDGSKTGDVEVSAYWYSDDESIFTRKDDGYSPGQSFTATKTGYVMLKVEPYSSNSVGTFAIGYQ